MLVVLGYLVLAAAATGVVWKGSDFLERSSENLAIHYGLPTIVHGAIIAAVGSSFPELSSTVLAALLHGEFELGVAAITGSAIFNILVIPSAATLVGEDVLDSNRDLVFKEAQFYIIAVATLLLTFSFAAIYNPVSGDQILGTMTRPLAMLPVLVYGLYVFLQYQDTVEHDAERSVDITPLKQWGMLAASLAIITVGVEGLVRAAIGLGNALNTPSFLWGLTIIAAGTSLPDAFVSIKTSKEGKSVTSVSNVLGSNIFDLLIAIPAGILVAGSAVINYSRAAPMMGYLVFATIALFVFMRTDLKITEKEAYGLLSIYLLFLIWMTLETIGVTSLAL